jgi:hypothetical protein
VAKRRETPIVIQPPTEVPTWDQLPSAVQDIVLKAIDRRLRRLEAQGLQVWLPAGVPVND